MELAAASEMSPGYRVDKQPTWHPIWRARYRMAADCHPEGSGPAVYDAKLQGPPRALAALLGRACLEMVNPRVEIGIDGAIRPESASNSPTKLS
jgi:hypothetical protein